MGGIGGGVPLSLVKLSGMASISTAIGSLPLAKRERERERERERKRERESFAPKYSLNGIHKLICLILTLNDYTLKLKGVDGSVGIYRNVMLDHRP